MSTWTSRNQSRALECTLPVILQGTHFYHIYGSLRCVHRCNLFVHVVRVEFTDTAWDVVLVAFATEGPPGGIGVHHRVVAQAIVAPLGFESTEVDRLWLMAGLTDLGGCHVPPDDHEDIKEEARVAFEGVLTGRVGLRVFTKSKVPVAFRVATGTSPEFEESASRPESDVLGLVDNELPDHEGDWGDESDTGPQRCSRCHEGT